MYLKIVNQGHKYKYYKGEESIFSTQSVLASESVDDENDNGGYIADDTERLEESFSYDGYSLTTKYDPRESNHLTDIRNQSDVGICWMYAAASTEEQFIATQDLKEVLLSLLRRSI